MSRLMFSLSCWTIGFVRPRIPDNLCVLGEDISTLLLGGLSPCSLDPVSPEVKPAALPFIGPHSESDTTALALALSFSFSLSVWFTGLGMPRLPAFPKPVAGSLSLEV